MSRSHHDYTIACICPMGLELAPVKAMLDKLHPSLPTKRDQNNYILGEMGGHNVVIAVLPQIGTCPAAIVAVQLLNDFPSVRYGFLTGIGGGVPDQNDARDIRLGDVVVSKPSIANPGVVQFDNGKVTTGVGFQRKGSLDKPPPMLLSSMELLEADYLIHGSKISHTVEQMLEKHPGMQGYRRPGVASDQLFHADYPHQDGTSCSNCNENQVIKRKERLESSPKIHYGTVGSSNTIIKDAKLRDQLRDSFGLICVETEAAGITDSFPCLVVRGLCDYADSHKNKEWQPYAAAVAAAYVKELVTTMTPRVFAEEACARPRTTSYHRGLNLLDAALLDESLFIGRDEELKAMEAFLSKKNSTLDQRILVLGGMGGIGKTQIARHYARSHSSSYSSVFWLNATSESTLLTSLRRLAPRIFGSQNLSQLQDEDVWTRVSLWLSESENSDWLLIYDNYDDPDEFRIENYRPFSAHGSIIITTRQPDQVEGHRIRIKPLENVKESLQILASRSARPGALDDAGALQLAERLDGLPLALATAGAFLKQSAVSFVEYLEQYEKKWQITRRSRQGLPDYQTRTLYTTWNLSLTQIENEVSDAGKLLGLLAYFDNQDIWHGLIRGHTMRDDLTLDAPEWFNELSTDKFIFEELMTILVRYCLVDPQPQTGSYSIHICIHDWALHELNKEINPGLYKLAFRCISNSYIWRFTPPSWIENKRLIPHFLRLVHGRLGDFLEKNPAAVDIDDYETAGDCFRNHAKLAESEKMLIQAIRGCERSPSPDDLMKVSILSNLAYLHRDRGRLQEAENTFQQALALCRKQVKPNYDLEFQVLSHLGIVYRDQGELDKAELVYTQALETYPKKSDKGCSSLCSVYNNLGNLYRDQGKPMQAEKMIRQALKGYEQTIGPHHTLSLAVLHNLGVLCQDKGNLDEAEDIYRRVLQGYEKVLSADHRSMLDLTSNLGSLYMSQDKLEDAEQMFQQTLKHSEKALGANHVITQRAKRNLAIARRERSDASR